MMNKIMILGNITNDIEVKKTQSGKSYCRFSVAVNEAKDKTTFIDCQAWEKQAELLGTFFGKGQKILVEGKWNVNSYQLNDGTKKKDVTCLVDRIEFVEPKKVETKVEKPFYEQPQQQQMDFATNTTQYTDIKSDDLPFY